MVSRSAHPGGANGTLPLVTFSAASRRARLTPLGDYLAWLAAARQRKPRAQSNEMRMHTHRFRWQCSASYAELCA